MVIKWKVDGVVRVREMKELLVKVLGWGEGAGLCFSTGKRQAVVGRGRQSRSQQVDKCLEANVFCGCGQTEVRR